MSPQYDFILIDDSVFDLFIYEKLILKSGVARSITTFNAASNALQYLIKEEPALPVSIILLDLQMPDMNGFEFIDQYSQLSEFLKNKIRVFMLSSTIDSRDIEKAKASPHIIDLLSKPLDMELLKKRLSHLIPTSNNS